jgi:hypothetical protein
MKEDKLMFMEKMVAGGFSKLLLFFSHAALMW